MPDQKDLLKYFAEIAADPIRRQRAHSQIQGMLARISFAEFVKAAWPVLEPGTPLEWNWHHQLMCDTLQAMFYAWKNAKSERGKHKYARRFTGHPKNTVINCPPGSLKPVHVEGMVQERQRGLIRAGDVKVGDYLLTHKGRFRRVNAVANQGELPLIEFSTGRGKKIRVAGDHPLLTQRGWVEASQVTLTDVFAEVHPEEPCGTQTISNEEARLLGYLIGDGCLSQSAAATFTNQDPLTVVDFSNCCETLGFEARIKIRPPSQERVFGHPTNIINVCGGRGPKTGKPGVGEGPVRVWVRSHDLEGSSSYTKRVPKAVMEGNTDVIVNYLAAYWACDGDIHDRRDLPRSGRVDQTTQTVRVGSTTVSEGLARDHQKLLQRLGLSFRIRKKVTKLKSKRQGDFYTCWDVVASDQDTCAKFMETFRPHIRHEKASRVQNYKRSGFDKILNPDPVIEISDGQEGQCVCFEIEEDSSFSYEGVAVHNSRIIAVCYPVWCWLDEPSMKFICLSVNEDATLRDGRMSRDLLRSEWFQNTFQPKFNLKQDQDAISNYGNTAGGERLSRASGSEVVGLRGDCWKTGTLVETPGGPVPIESLVVGDLVWCSTDGSEFLKRRVEAVRTIVNRRTIKLHLEYDWNGSQSKTEILECTPDHKLYTWRYQWISAENTLGTHLVGATGLVRVTEIEEGDICDVHDIQVADVHTFLVGKSRIISHNCLLIDDPNNPKEAENKNERDHISNLWSTNLYNRVNDARCSMRIGVQQRVHTLDWSGTVIKSQGVWSPDNEFGWMHVVLPAEFEQDRKFVLPDVLKQYVTWPNAVTEDPRKVEGESIHPERFTDQFLKAEKDRWRNTGQYAGQMQQRPAMLEGTLVQRRWLGWFRLAEGVRDDIVIGDNPRPALCHDGAPVTVHQKMYAPNSWDFDWMTISVDPAAKRTEKGSQYGLLCIAGKGGRRFVLDDRTQRGAFHEILDVIKDMIRTWRPDSILIEAKAAGPDLMDTLREQMLDGSVPMVAIEECEPGNQDKEMRLQSCLSLIKNGALYLLDGAPWLGEFVDELTTFPGAENDDRVDSLSQCLNNKRAANDDLPDW